MRYLLFIFIITGCKGNPEKQVNLYDFVVGEKSVEFYEIQGDYPGSSGNSYKELSLLKNELRKIKVFDKPIDYNYQESGMCFYIDMLFNNEEIRIRICYDHLDFMLDNENKNTYKLSQGSVEILKDLCDSLMKLKIEK